jgi:tetratricopeptide (TPR) repeat protein
MPSLKQLEEFQESFLNMGRERELMAALRQMPEDYPLPENEPAGPDPVEAETAASGPSAGESAPAEDDSPDDFSLTTEDGELDFGAFLNTAPGDLGVPEPEDTVDESSGAPPETPADKGSGAPSETVPAAGGDDADNDAGDVPSGLLDGFADDIEDSAGDETAPSDMDFDLGDFNLDNIDGMGGDVEGFDLSPEGIEELDDTADAVPDTTAFPDTATVPDAAAVLDTADTAADADTGVPAGGGGADGEADDSQVPSWNPDGDAAEDNSPPDPFENFDIESDTGAVADLKPGKTEAVSPGVLEGMEDFDLSEIEGLNLDQTGKTVPRAAPDARGKRRGTVKADGAGPAETEEVEEINLNEEQYEKLIAALDSYPLNVRMIIEEIIVEQAVEPALMSALVKLLVSGGSARDAAALAGKILGRTINIPKGFEKKTGEALEAEKSSLSYIFVHRFLPLAALSLAALLFIASLVFLVYQYIYLPIRAESIYQAGFEQIKEGEYERANDRFDEAFNIHRVKNWFYRYADAFKDERQYLYAERKYDELLRWYPRDKKGALDYAAMETALWNYSKAENIVRSNILDYAPLDREGLLALGDNYLAWGEDEPARYEDARFAYAKLLENYGWTDPVLERMLLYFIRTDNLAEVISLQQQFDEAGRRTISPRALTEMAGYLLDKRLEEPDGVPDENISRIEGLRRLLLRATRMDPALPEAHYHLARYYHVFGSKEDERITLETALSTFDNAPEESSRRIGRRVDAERRMADVLINVREFFRAEEHLVKGIGIFEDALRRQRLSPAPEYARLYADLGDLEYFTKSGDMETALGFYRRAEQNGWAPPEIQYRMGAAHYQLGQWESALERFFAASEDMPLNRRLLHALGNTSYERGNFYAAQGYYTRLLHLLENEYARFPTLTPDDRPDHLDLAERLIAVRNNLGVTLEALTQRTGSPEYRASALGLYAESSRSWDIMSRDPETMIRPGAGELSTPGINLAYLNSRNILYPRTGYRPELYRRIDRDVLEPSVWEGLVPPAYRITGLR